MKEESREEQKNYRGVQSIFGPNKTALSTAYGIYIMS